MCHNSETATRSASAEEAEREAVVCARSTVGQLAAEVTARLHAVSAARTELDRAAAATTALLDEMAALEPKDHAARAALKKELRALDQRKVSADRLLAEQEKRGDAVLAVMLQAIACGAWVYTRAASVFWQDTDVLRGNVDDDARALMRDIHAWMQHKVMQAARDARRAGVRALASLALATARLCGGEPERADAPGAGRACWRDCPWRRIVGLVQQQVHGAPPRPVREHRQLGRMGRGQHGRVGRGQHGVDGEEGKDGEVARVDGEAGEAGEAENEVHGGKSEAGGTVEDPANACEALAWYSAAGQRREGAGVCVQAGTRGFGGPVRPVGAFGGEEGGETRVGGRALPTAVGGGFGGFSAGKRVGHGGFAAGNAIGAGNRGGDDAPTISVAAMPTPAGSDVGVGGERARDKSLEQGVCVRLRVFVRVCVCVRACVRLCVHA